MKKTILTISLIAITFLAFSQSELSERQQIENTIELYFDGWATSDSTKLGKAMHSSCHLKNYNNGKFTEYTRTHYLSLFKNIRERNVNLITRIVFVDVTNNMGSAKVELSTEKDLYTDYFNLIKTTDGWFIADKVSTRTPHRLVEISSEKK
jgi:hypothetical protein